MTLICPHCGASIVVEERALYDGEFGCICGKAIWLEIDEDEEGPTFTLLPSPPDNMLYPPSGD